MKKTIASRTKKRRRSKVDVGRPSIGIRELKAKASAIIDDVKGRRVSYAVTKRGTVEALIVPVDAGERLLGQPDADSGWNAWQMLVERLTKESSKKTRSAVAELEQMRR
jgi:antitoxin (DNA-binding transcriptional repressor) of toxin-antitoxin stability system